MLFLDLTKAFDFALREVVMGWCSALAVDVPERRKSLLSRGLPAEHVSDLSAWLDEHDSLLRQLAVPDNVIATVNSLHTSSWFLTPGSSRYVVTYSGGRQGCKLGALVFNLIYSLALRSLRTKLLAAGVILHIRPCTSQASFFEASVPTFGHDVAAGVPIVEATYVDDEAVFLSSHSPASLVFAMHTLINELVSTFTAFCLRINWSKRKTEAFVKFRGKASSNASRKLFGSIPGAEGKLAIQTSIGEVVLRAVHEYVYLGSHFASDGKPDGDAARHMSSAAAAYSPLASKVFGQHRLPTKLRIQLFLSLVIGRPTCNIHLWPAISLESYRRLNSLYMRGLRQIAGCQRYKAGIFADLQVRRVLGAASL